jgi:hypothetical protein
MSTSVSAIRVRFDEDSFWVDLTDGRTLGVPLAWFPRLLNSTPELRGQVRISSRGLHWDSLDEDISIAGLLAGLGDQGAPNKTFAAQGTLNRFIFSATHSRFQVRLRENVLPGLKPASILWA